MKIKAEARHGNVLLAGDLLKPLTREEAADLLVSIASAIQHAGDISEPRSVHLHDEVYQSVEGFKKGG